jgi:hypothetical protein
MLKKYFKSPCKNGRCLISAACRYKFNYVKVQQCPEYFKYSKRIKFLQNCRDYPVFTINFILFMIPIIWIVVAVVWGSWDIIKFLWHLF